MEAIPRCVLPAPRDPQSNKDELVVIKLSQNLKALCFAVA